MMIARAEAIKSLDNDAQFSIQHLTDGDVITWHTTPIDDGKINTELSRLQAEFDAQEYARSRKTDYPEIGDQLDALYHAGVFPANMAARIKETKDKYPK